MEPVTISEKEAQDAVAKLLPKAYYRSTHCYFKCEEHTNEKKRADILIAYNTKKNSPYTIVVEVKSNGTLQQLKPELDYKRQVYIGRITTGFVMVTFMVASGWAFIVNGLGLLILLLAVFGCVAIVIAFLNKVDPDVAKSVPVLTQLRKYPANEKWVAVPHDTFVNKEDEKNLIRFCKREGVGYVVLKANNKLARRARPKPVHETNCYIEEYLKSPAIIHEINQLKRYRGSPSVTAKVRRQSLVAGVLLVVAGFIWQSNLDNPFQSVGKTDSADGAFPRQELVPVVPPPDDPASARSLAEDNANVEGERYSREQTCDYFNGHRGNYIIVDRIHSTKSAANDRVEILRKIGYSDAMFISTGCFKSSFGNSKYFVHTNVVYQEQSEAEAAANELAALEIEHGIKVVYSKPLRMAK